MLGRRYSPLIDGDGGDDDADDEDSDDGCVKFARLAALACQMHTSWTMVPRDSRLSKSVYGDVYVGTCLRVRVCDVNNFI